MVGLAGVQIGRDAEGDAPDKTPIFPYDGIRYLQCKRPSWGNTLLGNLGEGWYA